MDNKYDLILELRQLHIREYEIKAEIRTFIKELAESHRKFANGEVVAVYDETGQYYKDGVVAGAFILPVDDPLDIKSFTENVEKYYKRLSEIRYVVKGIKKDGTPSRQNVCWSASLNGSPEKESWYITKKQIS